VGEIYTSIEKEANCRLEEKLIKTGCSVKRHIDLTWWIKQTLLNSVMPENIRQIKNNSKGIVCGIGGYGRETSEKVAEEASSYDGIIKIMPAGCMPEIVTKAFCEKMQAGKGYRILHLIYDELDADTGYETRIEAFTDMLERRKNVLAGNRHRIDKYRPGFNE